MWQVCWPPAGRLLPARTDEVQNHRQKRSTPDWRWCVASKQGEFIHTTAEPKNVRRKRRNTKMAVENPKN
jgi:hypothetical protein